MSKKLRILRQINVLIDEYLNDGTFTKDTWKAEECAELYERMQDLKESIEMCEPIEDEYDTDETWYDFRDDTYDNEWDEEVTGY